MQENLAAMSVTQYLVDQPGDGQLEYHRFNGGGADGQGRWALACVEELDTVQAAVEDSVCWYSDFSECLEDAEKHSSREWTWGVWDRVSKEFVAVVVNKQPFFLPHWTA